jgi:hypothetical protein
VLFRSGIPIESIAYFSLHMRFLLQASSIILSFSYLHPGLISLQRDICTTKVADLSVVPLTRDRDLIHDRDSGYGSAFPVRMFQEPEEVGDGAIVGPRVSNHEPRE